MECTVLAASGEMCPCELVKGWTLLARLYDPKSSGKKGGAGALGCVSSAEE